VHEYRSRPAERVVAATSAEPVHFYAVNEPKWFINTKDITLCLIRAQEKAFDLINFFFLI
jgi:hypothetical protein